MSGNVIIMRGGCLLDWCWCVNWTCRRIVGGMVDGRLKKKRGSGLVVVIVLVDQ